MLTFYKAPLPSPQLPKNFEQPDQPTIFPRHVTKLRKCNCMSLTIAYLQPTPRGRAQVQQRSGFLEEPILAVQLDQLKCSPGPIPLLFGQIIKLIQTSLSSFCLCPHLFSPLPHLSDLLILLGYRKCTIGCSNPPSSFKVQLKSYDCSIQHSPAAALA
jgi:hypothetical protein